ncbi:ABC transporter D family member 1 [Tanacetum coccineum]
MLVATDSHLGYMEQDEVCRHDSFQAFDEIFKITEEKKVIASYFRSSTPLQAIINFARLSDLQARSLDSAFSSSKSQLYFSELMAASPSEDKTSLPIVLQLPIDLRVLPVRVASMFKVLDLDIRSHCFFNGTTVKYVLEQDKAAFVERLFKDEATKEKGVRTKMVERLFKDEATEEIGLYLHKMLSILCWSYGDSRLGEDDLRAQRIGKAFLVENLGEGIENGTRDQHFDSLDVKWLQTFTTMWIFVKGVITAEDSKNGQNLNLV